jgi:hypothetical protein
MSEPVVSDEDFAAGPLLLPGLPGIPAPEFCPLGTVTWLPPGRSVVCAEAGRVTIASAIAPITNLNMANSLLYDKKAEACRLHTVPQKRFRGPLRSWATARRQPEQDENWKGRQSGSVYNMATREKLAAGMIEHLGIKIP